MLVLGRKLHETIKIGPITIELVGGLHPDQKVRIGITAPPEYRIVRGELPDLVPAEVDLPLEDAEVPPR